LPEVLVGFNYSDDAGVYLLSPGTAIVQTVDFFPPVVDDGIAFGEIAAANALSDIYAMGGTPRTALSIVGFPAKGLDFTVLAEIMRGGLNKLSEAGVALLGGHSVRDDEVKFGYAVTGTIDLSQIKQNRNARAGDRLILTKPLGTGLITTAIKRGSAVTEHVTRAVDVMRQLSASAARIALRFQVDTMTDITGFGLAGHAVEVCKASNISAEISHLYLPLLPGALEYAAGGFCAGGLNSNRDFFSSHVQIASNVPSVFSDIVYDPQTSGGLLIFARPDNASALLQALRAADVDAADIGSTTEFHGTFVRVV